MTTTGKDGVDSNISAWLKILGIVATIAAGAIGSYKAARSDSKTEASASYATMKEAVERLEQNQKMMWEMMLALNGRPVRSFGDVDKSAGQMPSRVPLRPLPRNFDELVSKPLPLDIENQPNQQRLPTTN